MQLRPRLAWLFCAVLAAGCATPPGTPIAQQPVQVVQQPSTPNGTNEARLTMDRGEHFFDGHSNTSLGSIVITDPMAPHLIDLTAHADDIWDRIRYGFAIPNIETPLVAEKEAWFLSHQDYIQRSIDRSSRYLFHVVEELEKRNMPTELALLPFIESAYNPMALSSANASGMWQFIPSTGKNFNLRQDWWRDERRDVIASTDAALNYLEALYEMYGDWQLALASYNWGEGAVRRAIDRNLAAGRPTDYLSLSMPDETRNYIPKLQALKNIITNPAAFGIELPRINNSPYFVTVTKNRDMDVSVAARLAEMPVDEFLALNPSFNRPLIPGSTPTTLLLPLGKADIFQNNLEAESRPLATWQPYTLQRGEHLEKVAARFGMTTASLKAANGLNARSKIRPGLILLVQVRSDQGHSPLKSEVIMANVPEQPLRGKQRMIKLAVSHTSNSSRYVVRSGDTLFSIAHKYNLSVDQLAKANRLHGSTLSVGQGLTIPGAHAQS